MRIIKKIFLLFMICFVPFLVVKAEAVNDVNYDIKDMYIDSSVDQFGNLHVKEAIVINGSLNGFERVINYSNNNLKKWDKNNIDFSNSAIYNAKSIILNDVSSFKIAREDIGWDLFNINYKTYSESNSAQKGSSGIYTLEIQENGINVRIYNPNNSGYIVYYFEYSIEQAVVLHNDIAELYWTFIPQDFDRIKQAHIRVNMPKEFTNDLFRFWAHGPLTGDIEGITNSKNEEGKTLYSGVIAEATNINPGTGVDIRITFDKSAIIFPNTLNNSKVNAFDSIIEVETKRADDANKKRQTAKKIYHGLIGASIGYIIGLIILWIYVYIKYDKEYKVNFEMEYYREFTGDYNVEVVDYLMNKSISTNAMSASIMNLIYKHNIEVEEVPEKKNFLLKLKSRENITETEKKLLHLLFEVVAGKEEVTLKEIEKYSSSSLHAEKFMKAYNSWKKSVETDAKNENFFENNIGKKALLCSYLLIGLILVILSINLTSIFIPTFLGVMLLSICFFIYVISFKKWTKKGREHYLKWQAFKNFLKDFGAFEEKELPEVALWEKYLVYATVFGLAKEVQKVMKVKLSNLGYNEDTFGTNMIFYHDIYIGNAISNSISKSYTNSISSIASSSNSSGGGFGGGFSSGGGFGGGGGGGHGF